MAWTPSFGTSGIRGSVPKELSPEVAWRIGLSVATIFERRPLLLAHDNRTSSPLLAHALASGMMAGGSRVLYGGQVITPAISFYTRHRRLAGAVLITGSHIPAHMSGVEVLGSDGAPVSRSTEQKIEALTKTSANPCPWEYHEQIIPLPDVGPFWVSQVLRQINLELVRKKKFRIVLDAANGTAIPWLFDVLNQLDCTVIGVNARLDAFFSGRSPNLRVHLLERAAEIVKETGSDMGVGVDGDGDRAFFIDDKGRALMGDLSGTILARIELQRRKGGTIVTPINTSNVIEDIATKQGGKVVYSRVGPPAIVAAVKRHRAIFAFEESGKAIYPHLNYLSDSGLATAHLLEYLAAEEQKLSALIDALPKYHQLKRAIDCPNHLKKAVTDYALTMGKKQFPEASFITEDGVKIVFPDGWVLLRPSGTEPVFRCFAEARQKKRVKELLALGLEWINAVLEQTGGEQT